MDWRDFRPYAIVSDGDREGSKLTAIYTVYLSVSPPYLVINHQGPSQVHSLWVGRLFSGCRNLLTYRGNKFMERGKTLAQKRAFLKVLHV